MNIVIKPVQDYAPRLYIQENELICDSAIATIIENYAEKMGIKPNNLELYTKVLNFLDYKDSTTKGIYYCEDKFHIDVIPFLDNMFYLTTKATK